MILIICSVAEKSYICIAIASEAVDGKCLTKNSTKMKTTMREEIEKVLVENENKPMSKRVKVLVEGLSLRQFEARTIIQIYDREREKKNAEEAARTALDFTFGVEIECIVNHENVKRTMNDAGVNYQFECRNHRDNHNGMYRFVPDGSLSSDRADARAIEMVTPVLDNLNGGFDNLKNAVSALNAAGATVNKTCGLHVHVAVPNMTDEQYINTFVNYMYLENVIATFLAPSRRNGGIGRHWCDTLKDHKRDLLNAHTKGDVYNALDGNRYHCVNACAYRDHRTIEFRQHQGTVDYDKISNWALFCGMLVAWSRDHALTSDVTSIDEIPFTKGDMKAFFHGRAAEFARREGRA